jgi:hypothetical protein
MPISLCLFFFSGFIGYVQIAPDDRTIIISCGITRNNICQFSRLKLKLCTRGIIIENVRFSCKSGGQFYSTRIKPIFPIVLSLKIDRDRIK